MFWLKPIMELNLFYPPAKAGGIETRNNENPESIK